MATPGDNHMDDKMISFDFANERVFIGHIAASARLCGDKGHVQLHGALGAVLRPLTVLEREQALRNALASPQADKALFLADEIFMRALETEDTRHTIAAADPGVARAIALHLAGADINAPSLAQALAAVGERLGWSAKDIWFSPAAQFDQIASSLLPQQAHDWNQLIMLSSQENEAESEVEAITIKMATDLLRRAEGECDQQELGSGSVSGAADFVPDAAALAMNQQSPVDSVPPGGPATALTHSKQPENGQQEQALLERFMRVAPTQRPGVAVGGKAVEKVEPVSSKSAAKQAAGQASIGQPLRHSDVPGGPAPRPQDTGQREQRLTITTLGEGEPVDSAIDTSLKARLQNPDREGLTQRNQSVDVGPTGLSQVADRASLQSQDNVYPFAANTDSTRLDGLRLAVPPVPVFHGNPAAAFLSTKSTTQGAPANLQNLDSFFQTAQESIANELAELLNSEADLRGID